MKRLFFVAVLLIASSLTALAQPAKGDYKNINLVETLEAAGNFKTLLIALDKTGLTDTLKGAGPFTIFAPNDEAFAKLPSGVLDALMKDPAKLRALLLYHITAGKLSFKDLQSRTDKSLTMMDNTKAEVQCSSSPANSDSKAKIIGPESKANMHDNDLSPALMVINKSAKVVLADLSASNGMIHVIDTVLAPGTHWLGMVTK